MNQQVFNRTIKDICKEVKINEKVIKRELRGDKWIEKEYEKWEVISSHSMRRSFATNFYEAGFPVSELILITNHSTEKQFFDYVKADKKNNAIKVLTKYKKLMGNNFMRIAK